MLINNGWLLLLLLDRVLLRFLINFLIRFLKGVILFILNNGNWLDVRLRSLFLNLIRLNLSLESGRLIHGRKNFCFLILNGCVNLRLLFSDIMFCRVIFHLVIGFFINIMKLWGWIEKIIWARSFSISSSIYSFFFLLLINPIQEFSNIILVFEGVAEHVKIRRFSSLSHTQAWWIGFINKIAWNGRKSLSSSHEHFSLRIKSTRCFPTLAAVSYRTATTWWIRVSTIRRSLMWELIPWVLIWKTA